jgi:hypothetical protein
MKTSQELTQDNRCNHVQGQDNCRHVSKIVSPNENHLIAVHEESPAKALSKDSAKVNSDVTPKRR